MKPTIVFFYKDNILGGAELLIAKVARQFTLQKYKAVLVCCTVMDDVEEEYKNAGIEIVYEDTWINRQKVREILSRFEETYCFTFFWADFLEIYRMHQAKKKTVFYAVHFMALLLSVPNKLYRILKPLVLRCINNAIKDNKIICMDEMTVEKTISFFGEKNLAAKELRKAIIRIPVDVPKMDVKKLSERANRKDFRILAIARADFPFKGYLLGLIDKIAQYYDKNVQLDIVMYGKDEKQLYDKIASLPLNIKKNLKIYGKTNYDKLDGLFETAKLYVGMGTTLIDASVRGVISIPIESYTYNVLGSNFFYDDYTLLAWNKQEEKFDELFEIVYNFSPDEYLEKSRLSIELVKQHYSSEMAAKKLLAIFSNAKYDNLHFSMRLYNVVKDIYRTLKQIVSRNKINV